MEGATEYANMFKTGQYGKFYLVSASHGRGATFHIQILPEGEKAITNGNANLCRNKNAVEVYGIISGHPGWTEVYGWLHKGKWQEDFKELVIARKKEIAAKREEGADALKNKKEEEAAHISSLLKSY